MPRSLAPRAPIGQEREYQRDLRRVLAALANAVETRLIPALPGIFQAQAIERPAPVRADAAPDDLARLMKGVRLAVETEITEDEIRALVQRRGLELSRYNRDTIRANIKRVIGIDPFFGDAFLANEIGLFTVTNVGLITSLRGEALNKIETMTFNALRTGRRAEDLAADLRKYVDPEVGNVRARANLIARDQIGKLNGQLTRLRQTDLGIRRYIWRTMGDEVVRDMHQELDGRVFRWDTPPITNSNGDRNHPGEDYQCRCYADPVLEDVVPGLSTSDD